MINRNSFLRGCKLNLKGVVISDKLENQLSNYYEITSGNPPLLIDFSESEFIEIATLLNCLSLIIQRKENNLETFIGYPTNKKVRDFLRIWRFHDAIEKALNCEFKEILLKSNHGYLTEPQTTYSGIGDGIDALEYNPDWNNNNAIKRNFFEFTIFKNEEADSINPYGPLFSAPRHESSMWAGTLIKQVLKKHLTSDSPKDDIARVIIFESLSNAVRHPNAGIIAAVSKLNRSHKNHRSLRICVWDNGDSIASTLLRPLQKGLSVKAKSIPKYMCERIHVKIRTFDNKSTKEVIVDQSEDIDHNTAEARLLLASLFPGISRTVAEKVPNVQPYDANDDTWFSWLPGMGLYSLSKIVLDQFQGSLFIRSGHYRLVIEVAHDSLRKQKHVRYKCKITKYPTHYPSFKGNLLTIQLPIIEG